MNPLQAYRQTQSHSGGPTRIDLLLTLYDGACEKLTEAQATLVSGDLRTAVGLVAKVQLIVMELAAGVRVEVDREMGENLLRLYEFVTHQLATPTVASIDSALQVLSTLRDAFRSIRD